MSSAHTEHGLTASATGEDELKLWDVDSVFFIFDYHDYHYFCCYTIHYTLQQVCVVVEGILCFFSFKVYFFTNKIDEVLIDDVEV